MQAAAQGGEDSAKLGEKLFNSPCRHLASTLGFMTCSFSIFGQIQHLLLCAPSGS